MGRARSAIAAQTTIEELRNAMLDAYGVELAEEGPACEEFYDAADFVRPHTEELGGDLGSEGWYFWKHGDWAIAGDLAMTLCRNDEALQRLSEKVGPIVVGAMDEAFEFAVFAYVEGGEIKRKLMLEDDVCLMEGLPVKAERGRHLMEFDLIEGERLWTSYGLPTFEHDPLGGPFQTIAVKRRD